jgi:hypothetical protein
VDPEARVRLGAVAPLAGNRWHAIRYAWGGWGKPFIAAYTRAAELAPAGAQLWTWIGGQWARTR